MLNRTEKRFDQMKEIHVNFFPFLNSFLTQKSEQCEDKDIGLMLKEFALDKIASKQSSRAHFLYLIANILNIETNEAFYFLCASLELNMIQAYCYNVGADGKSGYVGDKKLIAFRTATFLRNCHSDFIEETSLLNKEQKEKLKSFTEKIYTGIYIGQVFDTLVDVYENFNKTNLLPLVLPEDRKVDAQVLASELKMVEQNLKPDSKIDTSTIEDFVWKRTYGLNAYMIELYPEILSSLFLGSEPDVKLKPLTEYAFCYGMLMMVVNDIQDFALDLTGDNTPTREKVAEDVFIDIKNERLTWPIQILLKNGNLEHISLLEEFYKHKSEPVWQEKVRSMIVNDGYIKLALIDATAYTYIALNALKDIEPSEDKSFLEDLVVSLVKGNRYVKLLSIKFDAKIRPQQSLVNKRVKELTTWLSKEKIALTSVFGIEGTSQQSKT